MVTENERRFIEHGKKYIMIMEQNKLSGDWACWIPGKPMQMYFIGNKRRAKAFVKKVNENIENGAIDTDKL